MANAVSDEVCVIGGEVLIHLLIVAYILKRGLTVQAPLIACVVGC